MWAGRAGSRGCRRPPRNGSARIWVEPPALPTDAARKVSASATVCSMAKSEQAWATSRWGGPHDDHRDINNRVRRERLGPGPRTVTERAGHNCSHLGRSWGPKVG